MKVNITSFLPVGESSAPKRAEVERVSTSGFSVSDLNTIFKILWIFFELIYGNLLFKLKVMKLN